MEQIEQDPSQGELPQVEEENILEEIVIAMVIENHVETKDILTNEDTLVEDPLIEAEGPLQEDILMEVGDTLEEEECSLREEDPLDLLEKKDHQALKDLLDL